MEARRVWLPCDGDAFVPAVEVKAEPNGGGRSETATVSRWCAGGWQEELVRLPTARLKELSPVVGDPSATCDDLTSLPDICLPAVLHNLRLRFASDAIYTSIGPVLISVNPHKRLGHLDDFLRYCDDLDRAEDELLPPHVYRIARAAFTALVRTGKSQSILVSGDSGAGKTEACKLVVACLARLAPSGRAGATEAALGGALMLEAWGNATTTQNKNSSRFGKWLAVELDAESAIHRCSLQPYLLERSRVVVHGPL